MIKENAPNLKSLIFGEEAIVRAKEGLPSSKIIAAVELEEKKITIRPGLFKRRIALFTG